VLARNRTGSCYSVHGGYFTAENYNGAGNITDLIAFEVHAKQNSVATGDVKALRVMDESGSSTGTHYGIELTTGDGAFMRAYGIMITANAASGAGWTSAIAFACADRITNLFSIDAVAGFCNATAVGGSNGSLDFTIGGVTHHIPYYD
jgi:hypothetical protein